MIHRSMFPPSNRQPYKSELLLFNHNVFTVHLKAGIGEADVSRCMHVDTFFVAAQLSICRHIGQPTRFHPKNHFAFGRLILCACDAL